MPKLGINRPKTLKEMREEIFAFVDGKGSLAFKEISSQQHEFWGYYADWDWFLLGQNVMGGMMSLPNTWPFLCMDVKQYQLHLGASPYGPLGIDTAHNALADAIWTKEYWRYLEQNRRDGSATCRLCD